MKATVRIQCDCGRKVNALVSQNRQIVRCYHCPRVYSVGVDAVPVSTTQPRALG